MRGEPVANPIDPPQTTSRRSRLIPRNDNPMHQAAHVESHFTASELVRDIVIGMSDGLTVPFALAAGLSGIPVATTAVVVTAGLAEIAAGSIAMGLGGYLAAKSDAEHYVSEKTARGNRDPHPPARRARGGRRGLPRVRAGSRLRSNRSCRRLKTTIRPGSIS